MKKHTLLLLLIIFLGFYHISAMIFNLSIPSNLHTGLLIIFLISILYLQCESLHVQQKEESKWKTY